MTIGDRIKAKRLEKGMTLLQVAKAVDVTEATVQRWESGYVKNLRKEKIQQLSVVLDTTPAYLMGWEAPSPDLERTQREQQIVDMFREMPKEAQDALISLAKQFLQRK